MLIYKNPSPVNIRRNLSNPDSAQNTSAGISVAANQKKQRLPPSTERRMRTDRRRRSMQVTRDRRRSNDRRGPNSPIYKNGARQLENIEDRVGTRLSIEA